MFTYLPRDSDLTSRTYSINLCISTVPHMMKVLETGLILRQNSNDKSIFFWPPYTC